MRILQFPEQPIRTCDHGRTDNCHACAVIYQEEHNRPHVNAIAYAMLAGIVVGVIILVRVL